jgi:hypothetical protein
MDNPNQGWVIYCRRLMTILFRHNYVIMTLYILERLSAWSTLQICPSWPRSKVRLNLLLALFHKCLSCLSLPPSILLFVPTTHISHSYPPSPPLQLNTSAQVNNTAMLHRIHTIIHIYITFILLFIPFFILLPLLWAGRLAQTLLVCHYIIWNFNIAVVVVPFFTKQVRVPKRKGMNWRLIMIVYGIDCQYYVDTAFI